MAVYVNDLNEKQRKRIREELAAVREWLLVLKNNKGWTRRTARAYGALNQKRKAVQWTAICKAAKHQAA